MIRNIKKVLLTASLVVVSMFLTNNTANAEEFAPDIKGTLTNAGDVVRVENVTEFSGEWIKYVSSTDEFMYVYTDLGNGNPILSISDEQGKRCRLCDDLYRDSNGNYDFTESNMNIKNSEVYFKLKKGKVYYIYAYSGSSNETISYDVKLIKAPKIPEVNVYAQGKGDDGNYKKLDLSDLDVSVPGLSYDKNNRILTMNNYSQNYAIEANAQKTVISDEMLEIKVLGNNILKADYSDLLSFNTSVRFTGDGVINIEKPTEEYKYNNIIDAKVNTLIFDGPTININANGKNIIYAWELCMNSGNVVFSGKYTPSYRMVEVYHDFEINGGKMSFDCETSNGFICVGTTFLMTDGEINIGGIGNGYGIKVPNRWRRIYF